MQSFPPQARKVGCFRPLRPLRPAAQVNYLVAPFPRKRHQRLFLTSRFPYGVAWTTHPTLPDAPDALVLLAPWSKSDIPDEVLVPTPLPPSLVPSQSARLPAPSRPQPDAFIWHYVALSSIAAAAIRTATSLDCSPRYASKAAFPLLSSHLPRSRPSSCTAEKAVGGVYLSRVSSDAPDAFSTLSMPTSLEYSIQRAQRSGVPLAARGDHLQHDSARDPPYDLDLATDALRFCYALLLDTTPA
ncbi:hypothetical protein B0H14DRAFT_3862796 [Mycena olivaceomarginata]|nr:hypothetical protein B0H14DRAFT_3862796 [Mycena olivaceomarginata]